MSRCSCPPKGASTDAPTVAIDEHIATHPCYSEKGHHFFARMHLGVAPKCNIQCNYCNRKYDCANESRPGVVAERVTPQEALKKVYYVAGKVKELSVIGIAGPGDALANPESTFRTLFLIKEHFPDLTLCLSTNGLALPDYIKDIAAAGVGHVTVTVNTFDPETASKIYDWVLIDRRKEHGREAFDYFLRRQQEGIRALSNLGVFVKVNSLLIPGLNDRELPSLSRKIRLMGAFIHNIMPLIAQAEHGTAFGLMSWPEPTHMALEAAREACGDMKQMAHCRQCRADAVGKLGEDNFTDFKKEDYMSLPMGSDNGLEARRQWKDKIESALAGFNPGGEELTEGSEEGYLVAACTKGMGVVNQHFGHAREFFVYRVRGEKARLLNVRKVKSSYCEGTDTCDYDRSVLDDIINTIGDCHAVVCLRVGYGPHRELESRGIMPVVVAPAMPIEEAVIKASQMLEGVGVAPAEKATEYGQRRVQ